MSGADELRAMLAAGHVTHVPGVYDPITTALAVKAGHSAVHLSGAAVSTLMLGRPVYATQIADRAGTLVPALSGVPLVADAGTGYASPSQAVWTALAYVRAGISGLHLEDQVSPGRGEGVAATIAALATQVPEIVVIARTDAYGVSGLEDAIERCRSYADAGADAVFPDGVDDLGDLAKLHDALPGVPIVINRSEAGGNAASPTVATTAEVSRTARTGASDADLAAVGVRLVLHPVAALLAALRAASLVYRAIADTGSAESVDRLPWAALTALAGPDEALDADARYTPGRLQT
jgi:methylisocitrate lyase